MPNRRMPKSAVRSRPGRPVQSYRVFFDSDRDRARRRRQWHHPNRFRPYASASRRRPTFFSASPRTGRHWRPGRATSHRRTEDDRSGEVLWRCLGPGLVCYQGERRFGTQPQQFHGEEDKVDYALTLLGKWENNDEKELRNTRMRNPADLRASLVNLASPCLAGFALFEKELYDMFGNKDRAFNAVTKATTEGVKASPRRMRMNRFEGTLAVSARTGARQAGMKSGTS